MKLSSAVFENGQMLPIKYTCDGENVSPPLMFEDIPTGTKSLVLVMEDPDAPEKTFVHWILFNMSPNLAFIDENGKPGTAQVGLNDFGKNEYGGACPPAGDAHRYIFRLYALDEKLDEMPEFTDKEMLVEAMNTHILEEAELIGLYLKN